MPTSRSGCAAVLGLYALGCLAVDVRPSQSQTLSGALDGVQVLTASGLAVDGDADERWDELINTKMGGADWHAIAVDGTLADAPYEELPHCRDLAMSVNSIAGQKCDDSLPPEPLHTSSDILSERLLKESLRRGVNFVTPKDKRFGNGTVDLARSFISLKWHTPADIECPLPPKLQDPRPSYSTKPCSQAWLTGKSLEQSLARLPEFLVTVPPDASFALSAQDRSIQVLLRGGFDFETVAGMLGMHVGWYSAPERFLNPKDKVCTHILPTPYETKFIGEIIVDEDVVQSGGKVYWASKIGVDDLKSNMAPFYEVGSVPPFATRVNKLFFRGREQDNPEQRGDIYDMGLHSANDDWLNATRDNVVEVHEFGSYKYVVDIGGRSGTTWSALSNKMRMGSLVFRVESGVVDWWHGGLVADEHYLAVKKDLSDLHEKFLWAEANPEDALRIAEAGRAYAVEARTPAKMDAHVKAVAERTIDEKHTCAGPDSIGSQRAGRS